MRNLRPGRESNSTAEVYERFNAEINELIERNSRCGKNPKLLVRGVDVVGLTRTWDSLKLQEMITYKYPRSQGM